LGDATARLALITLCAFAMALSGSAQGREESTGRASGTVGASFGNGGVTPSFAAALSYWPTNRVGIEFELAYSRNLEFNLDLCPPPLICILGGRWPVKGRTLSLIPHVVVEPPIGLRVRPYLLAGVGLAHLRQRYIPGPGTVGGQLPQTLVVPVEFTRSKKTAALSAGGGVEVRISRRLAVGVDIRSRHLFDDEPKPDRFIVPAGTLSAVRLGSQASWAF
jgi:opacity protein-like surface antigen